MYRFYINDIEMFPIYDREASISEQMQSGEKYYKKTFDSQLLFVNTDYDYILAQPYNTKFNLRIEYSNINNWFLGYFYGTDCLFDKDNKIVYAKIISKDYFDEFEAYKDVEVNLAKINIKKTKYSFKVYPMLQFYVFGDTSVTNYINGKTWTQPAQQCDYVQKYSYYNEARLEAIQDVVCQRSIIYVDYLTIAENGIYVSNILYDDTTFCTFTRLDGKFYIKEEVASGNPSNIRVWNLYRKSDGIIYYQSETFNILSPSTEAKQIRELKFTGVYTGYEWYLQDEKILVVRLLCPQDTFNTIACDENQQLLAQNEAYPFIQTEFILDAFKTYFSFGFSDTTQVAETKFNIAANGEYFTQYETDNTYEYKAIGQGVWENLSIWFRGSADLFTLMKDNTATQYAYGYEVGDLIRGILANFNCSFSFFKTTDSSKFLYNATNPLTGIAKRKYIYTQISNLNGVNPTFNNQSQKDIITLGSVLDDLKRLMRLYTSITKYGVMKLEHTLYFDNGGTYSTQLVGIDLTNLINTRNEKTLADYIDKYTFDKFDSFKYISNEYLNASEDFNGQRIVVTSDETLKGEDDRRVQLQADIDYIRANSERNGNDGWFIGCLVASTDVMDVIDLDSINEYTKTYQNWGLCVPFIQKYYAIYDILGDEALINNITTSLTSSVKRIKMQDVEYNLQGIEEININKLIKSNLGIAKIVNYVVNLDTRTAKIKIAHDIN